MLPSMGEKLLADFERVTALERDEGLGHPIQTALAPIVARSQGKSGLEAMGWFVHRIFDGLPSPFITDLLTEAHRHFPSAAQYSDWVTGLLGISPKEYEFRQTFHRLSLALEMDLASGVHIKNAMAHLREELPANEIAREPAFIGFFLGEDRPVPERALAYLLIEEFQFTSLLPELPRVLPREHREMTEPISAVAVWQLLSCLSAFRGEPLLEEQWPQVLRELGALRETIEAQPELDPSGELEPLVDSLILRQSP